MNDIQINEKKDIIYSSFRLHKTGIEAIGDPTFNQWEECGKFIKKAEGSVKFWIGDWINYGEQKYGEMYAQALDATDLEYQTLKKAKWVSDKVEKCRRRHNLSYSHHEEVAKLKPKKQEEMLYLAEKEHLSVRELRVLVKEVTVVLPTPKLPEGKYNVIYADPPWKYDNAGISGAAQNHYPTMETEDMCEIKVPVAENAVLFLWVTNPFLKEGLQICESWGFEYKTNMVWIKNIAGQGFYVKGQHELLYIATRGKMRPLDNIYMRSVVKHDRLKHSQKPDIFYDIMEELYPKGKYLELFARNNDRPNWTAWGNEAIRG